MNQATSNNLSFKDKNRERNRRYRERNATVISERHKKWVEENREKRLEHQRRYRQKNRELLNQKNKEYDQINPDMRKNRTKRYYLENKDKVYAANALWRKNNPEAYRLIASAARARRRAHKYNTRIGRIDWKAIHERSGMICGICHGPIVGDFDYDHIIPLAKGGPHVTENIQLAHPSCNRAKRDTINYRPQREIVRSN